MKTSRIALGVALCFGAIAALPAQTPGWEQYLDQVRIKKAIADQLTPEQLEERRVRLAQWLAERAANAQTPNTPTGGPAHDTCPTTPYATGAFPFSVSDTTVGLVDDYDLPADTTDPTCTAPTTCTGGASSGSGPRGAIYTGTGTGADAAYKIRTDANCTLEITVDPTSTQDLAGILYQTQCSSSLADCGCVADTGVGGTAEVITLDAVAGTDYFVSADGYSTGATPPGPSGPYTVSVAVTSGSCNLTTDIPPLSSVPASGVTSTLATTTVGQTSAATTITFTNTSPSAATVTCSAPSPSVFSASPLSINVPAAGSNSTSVTFSPTAPGPVTGSMVCTAGAQTFNFPLEGTGRAAIIVPDTIPSMGEGSRWVMILSVLALGLLAFAGYSRRQ